MILANVTEEEKVIFWFATLYIAPLLITVVLIAIMMRLVCIVRREVALLGNKFMKQVTPANTYVTLETDYDEVGNTNCEAKKTNELKSSDEMISNEPPKDYDYVYTHGRL